ncbi:hypothetical protein [Methanooceanicella nereidis]|uniref:hypothetical protein n=1 Tax=Methanooceanicella nereidis TaxID=2052831 RepID=UPI001E3C7CD5|nr:hypothetical protein [Methanocella sp. CWC-04]
MTKDLSKDCIKERCAWFDSDASECCVKSFVMGRALLAQKHYGFINIKGSQLIETTQ